MQRHFAIVALSLFFSVGTPLWAQSPVRVTIPGSAFTPQGSSTQVDEVAGARRFRSKSRDPVRFTAMLRIPAPGAADPKMQRLVIHFRMNPSGPGGPTLRAVEVLNGSSAAFSLATDISGNYTVAEVTTPPQGANAWDLKTQPRSVSAQSIIRLTVQFPGAIDSSTTAGEFFLTSVVVDFPAKGPVFNEPATQVPIPSGLPAAPKGVIYAVNNENDLMWYRHDGRGDGSYRWADPKKVGNGWGFKQIFSGGDGVIYAINSDGDLLWYRHDGHADGSYRWTDPRKVGNGWDFKEVFYGGGGVIYAIKENGDLLWYRHDGHADGSMRWSQPKQVGNGWNFKQVFYGGGGVIYAIKENGDLLWYRHDGHADGSMRWSQSRQVGNGWNFKQVFYGGDGVIYAINDSGGLLWYRHDGHADGSMRWSQPRQVGNGWDFKEIFVDEPGS